MLDIGWSEMLMIAAVAIIVIGPKELPRTLRTIGRWIAKARSLTREFQSNVDDMITQSEIEEIKNTANSISNFNSENILEDIPSAKVNEIEESNTGLLNERSDRVGGTVVSEAKTSRDDGEATPLEAEELLFEEPNENSDSSQNPSDEKMTAKATET